MQTIEYYYVNVKIYNFIVRFITEYYTGVYGSWEAHGGWDSV